MQIIDRKVILAAFIIVCSHSVCASDDSFEELKGSWRCFLTEAGTLSAQEKEDLNTKIDNLDISDVSAIEADLGLLKLHVRSKDDEGYLLKFIFALRDLNLRVDEVLEKFPNISSVGEFTFWQNLKHLSNIIKGAGIEGVGHYLSAFEVNSTESFLGSSETGYTLISLSLLFDRAGENARDILDIIVNLSCLLDQKKTLLALASSGLREPGHLSEILSFKGKSYDEIFKRLDYWRARDE